LLNVGNGVDASFQKGEAADELAERAVAEGERVLAASGVSLVSAAEDAERRGSILQRRDDLPPQGGSSWQSLQRGTGESEIDYLAGEIVLQGRLLQVPTPASAAIVAATRDLTATGGEPRSLDAPAALSDLDHLPSDPK
jgi:2-dehydropantoate 2-reductase